MSSQSKSLIFCETTLVLSFGNSFFPPFLFLTAFKTDFYSIGLHSFVLSSFLVKMRGELEGPVLTFRMSLQITKGTKHTLYNLPCVQIVRLAGSSLGQGDQGAMSMWPPALCQDPSYFQLLILLNS